MGVKMARILKVISSQFRDLPFIEFIRLVCKTLYLDDYYLVYKVDITKTDRKEKKLIDGIKIEKGSIEELDQYRASLNSCPSEFKCHLHDNVENFFIAKDGSGIQHISWIYSKNDHNRLLTLDSRDVEIKHCLTMPSLRGKGIYPKVINEIIDYLGIHGVLRVFMCVDPNNISSIKGIEKSGFNLVGRVRFKKIFGIRVSDRLITSNI
jgi:GNAT superfamily N-acetyltransferase